MVQEILMRAKQAIFTSENIGRTQENNDMTVYCITHEVNKEVESIPIVFITGIPISIFILLKAPIMLENHCLCL